MHDLRCCRLQRARRGGLWQASGSDSGSDQMGGRQISVRATTRTRTWPSLQLLQGLLSNRKQSTRPPRQRRQLSCCSQQPRAAARGTWHPRGLLTLEVVLSIRHDQSLHQARPSVSAAGVTPRSRAAERSAAFHPRQHGREVGACYAFFHLLTPASLPMLLDGHPKLTPSWIGCAMHSSPRERQMVYGLTLQWRR